MFIQILTEKLFEVVHDQKFYGNKNKLSWWNRCVKFTSWRIQATILLFKNKNLKMPEHWCLKDLCIQSLMGLSFHYFESVHQTQ